MPDSPPAARLGSFVATARGNSDLRVAPAIRLNDRRHKFQHTSRPKTVNTFFYFFAKNLSSRSGSTKNIYSIYFYVEVSCQNCLALAAGVVADAAQCGGFLLGVEWFVRHLTTHFPALPSSLLVLLRLGRYQRLRARHAFSRNRKGPPRETAPHPAKNPNQTQEMDSGSWTMSLTVL